MLIEITAAQCRAARALLEWNQPKLATSAGLGLSTIVDFEKGRRALSAESIAAIRSALESAGAQFVEAGDVAEGSGVVLSRD